MLLALSLMSLSSMYSLSGHIVDAGDFLRVFRYSPYVYILYFVYICSFLDIFVSSTYIPK